MAFDRQLQSDGADAAPRVTRGLSWLLSALAITHVTVFLLICWLTIIRAPSQNMLDWLDDYRQYRQGGSVWAYGLLFFQEHRLVWMRLLTAVDASWFQSSGTPFIVVGLLALLAVAAWLAEVFLGAFPVGSPIAALAWLCPMLVLMTANAMDASVPVNIVYPLVLLFVVGACALFVNGSHETVRATALRRSLAVVMAAAAGGANAIGLLAWPVLLWAAWTGRLGWRWLLAIVVLTACYGLAYVHGMAPTGELVAPPDSMLAHAIKRLRYLLAYLGLPLARVPGLRPGGEGVGAVFFAAGIWSVARVGLRRQSATRLERIASCLILFALGGAFLAAAGRADFASEVDVPLRYTVLVTPLHVGLLGMVVAELRRWPAAQRRPERVLAFGVVVALLLLAAQLVLGRYEVAVADPIRRGVAQFYAGARDPVTEQVIYPGAIETADAIVARLRKAGLLAW